MSEINEPGLLGPQDIRQLCQTLNLRPTKSLGQNFVHDGGTVRRIAALSGAGSGDHIIEVGPGLGSLTLALLESGAAVSAIEIDPRLAQALPPTVKMRLGPDGMERLRVLNMDALKLSGPDDLGSNDADSAMPLVRPLLSCGLDPALQNEPTALVANLPYNVAVPIILHLLTVFPQIESVLVMVQNEVADRLVAGPGSKTYGIPSVKLAWFGQAQKVGMVDRQVFWPVPNVDSALVRVDCSRPEWGVPQQRVFKLVEAAFSQRRKTLRSALARLLGGSSKAEEVLRDGGIDPGLRGEVLSLSDFVALAKGSAAAVLQNSCQGSSAENVASKTATTSSINEVWAKSGIQSIAPGKVNLQLFCGPVRPDGYHDLATVFQGVSLTETVQVSVRQDPQIKVETRCLVDGAEVAPARQLRNLDPQDHLAYRAAHRLRAAFGGRKGADIQVTKCIPVAGGMAGGSADAAAALVAAAHAWELDLSAGRALELARELGADVPFALVGGNAWAIGRGDQIQSLQTGPTRHWVFVLAYEGLSTPAVFTQFDRMHSSVKAIPTAPSAQFLAALVDSDPRALAGVLHNDLAPAAMVLLPHLRQVRRDCLQAGALAAIISGSGPTIAALAADGASAKQIARSMRTHPQVRAALVATGPAPGAWEQVSRSSNIKMSVGK